MLNQTTVIRDLPLQQPYFGISLLDQAASFDNQACAFACQGCELFVSICEISAGSGITCSLGVSGGGGAEVAQVEARTGAQKASCDITPQDVRAFTG